MKKTLKIFMIFLLMVSCNHKHSSKENHIHSEKTDHSHNDDHLHEYDHIKNDNKEIHLNKEKLKSAKIKTDSIRKRKIRERLEVTGKIEVPPQSRATIYTPLEAFVEKTVLLPGDKVYKGQVIAILKHPNFHDLQYNFLESINKFKIAKSEYFRKKKLFDNNIASKKSFEHAQGVYNSAKNLINSFKSKLKLAGLSPKNIEKKGIQEFVYVKSPISGYVVVNNLNKGKFLSANEEMMEIIDNNHMHAELKIFSSDIIKLKEKDEFLFKPSGTDNKYKGYIQLINQKIDDKTKTVNVHGHFEDDKKLLKAGTYINAEILLSGKKCYSVPDDAIIHIAGEKFVFMEKNKEEFIPLEVTIGDTDSGFTELKTIEGNNFKIKIVTNGTHFLKGELLKNSGDMEGHSH